MKRDLVKGLLCSFAMTVAGVCFLVVLQPKPSDRIIGWLVTLFFGLGTIAIFFRMLWPLSAQSRSQFHSSVPDDIRIEQLSPEDEEIEEAWEHSSATQPLLSVDACKWKKLEHYQWHVSVYLAEFARDPRAVKILDPAIFEALKNTRNVVDVQRMDTEVWIVSGDPSGRDLVANAGAALAKFIPSIVPLILSEQSKS